MLAECARASRSALCYYYARVTRYKAVHEHMQRATSAYSSVRRAEALIVRRGALYAMRRRVMGSARVTRERRQLLQSIREQRYTAATFVEVI